MALYKVPGGDIHVIPVGMGNLFLGFGMPCTLRMENKIGYFYVHLCTTLRGTCTAGY